MTTIRPTRQQASLLKRGKLLNQKFRFKKDEEYDTKGFTRFYKKEESDVMTNEGKHLLEELNAMSNEHHESEGHARSGVYKKEEVEVINNEAMHILDELKNIGAMEGVNHDRVIPQWEALIMNKHNLKPLVDRPFKSAMDGIDSRVVPEDEMPKDTPNATAPPTDTEYTNKPHTSVLRARYDELVTELAMIVADRIKSFKKRSIVMEKITGEEYGFLEESCWSTGETTRFKYWPASWIFERCIGTNVIFEARFHHTTFELLTYVTVFAYDPKNVVTRNPNTYKLDNDDDLLAIISIYEKAIAFVYSKGKK